MLSKLNFLFGLAVHVLGVRELGAGVEKESYMTKLFCTCKQMTVVNNHAMPFQLIERN
jgi:hypothetical protein